jgi:outer membrane protein assembly factor BamB
MSWHVPGRVLTRPLPLLAALVVLAAGLATPVMQRTVPTAAIGLVSPPSTQDISPSGDARRPDAVLQAPLEQAWSRTDVLCPASPVLDGARTFTVVGDDNHREVLALDSRTGRTLWQTSFGILNARWRIAYDAGRVYALDQFGQITALDARLGVPLWTRPPIGGQDGASHPLAVNGRLYYVNQFGFWALDGATGVERFRLEDSGTDFVYADGRVILQRGSQLSAIAADDGHLLWSVTGPVNYALPDHLAVQQDRVYSGVGVYTATTGALLGPERYYSALDDDLGVTLELETHTEVMERVSDRAPRWASNHPYGDLVFAGHDVYAWGDRLTALDRVTGRPIWSSEVFPEEDFCNNNVPADGVNMNADTIVVSHGGGLYAFREPRMSVRSVVPARGSATGGQEVHLLGNGLSSVNRVRFGTTETTDVQVVSDRELIVRTPAMPAGPASVIALGPDGRSRTTSTTTYTATAAPRIDRVTPTAGPARGGTLVRVIGAGLAGSTAVSVGGVPVRALKVVSDRELEVLTPDVPAGSEPITVTGSATASMAWTALDSAQSRASATDRVEPGHSGVATGPLGTGLRRIWQRPVTAGAMPPLLAEGKVFTVSCYNPQPCQVTAMDRDGGQPLWQRTVGQATATAMAYGAGALYVSDQTGVTTALEGGTGATRWMRQSGGSGRGIDDTVLADDDLVVTQQTGARTAVDPASGLRRWYSNESGPMAMGPLGIYSSIYGYYGNAWKFDRSTGARVWQQSPPSYDGLPVPPTLSGSRLVVESMPEFSHVVDEVTGVPSPGPRTTTHRALAGDVTYGPVYSDADSTMHLAAQTLSGATLWSSMSVVDPLGAPLVADGRVYALDSQRRVHALDAATGVDVWSDQVGTWDPPGDSGVDAVIAAERRLIVSTPGFLTAYAAPGVSVTSMVPTSVKPGDTVTITGSGLSTLTDLRVGGVPVASWLATSDASATFTVPADAPGGSQQVVAVNNETASAQSSASTLNVNVPASVTNVAPDSGPAVGGQVVTVTGRGFSDAVAVTFGGVPGSSVQVVDDTTVRVTTPLHQPGTVAVAVRDGLGSSAANAAATYSYRLAPSITGITPSSVPQGVPVELTLSGSDLDAVTSVQLGGTVSSAVHAVDATQLKVVVVPPAAGSYGLTASGAGGQSSPATLSVVAAPVPSAPRSVAATSANAVVDLSWVAPETMAGLAGYRVVSEPAGSDVTVGASSTGLSLNGLTPGRTYTFSIVGIGELGSGVVATTSAVQVATPTPPSPSPSTGGTSGGTTGSTGGTTGSTSSGTTGSTSSGTTGDTTGGTSGGTTTGSAGASSPAPTPTQSTSRPSPAPASAAPSPATTYDETPPSVTLSAATISAGQRVTVEYRGSPNTTLTILSKTQPATSYNAIATVTLDAYGYGTSTHAPAKNTRIMARTASGLDSGQPLIQVRSVASINAARVGVRTYVFQGRVFPARPGRLVSLYRNGVLVAQARTDANGVYSLTKTLAGGTFGFEVRTASDTYNLGARSAVRTVTIR